jgi:hypothetical protein
MPLHTNKADHPRERLQCLRVPTQPEGVEPLLVLQRSDGRFIVYDVKRPGGDRTAWLGRENGSLDDAHGAARELAGVTR